MKSLYIALSLAVLIPASLAAENDGFSDGTPVENSYESTSATDLSTISNAEFFNLTSSSGPFSWLKGIKTPKDILQFIKFGVQTRLDLDYTIDTDTSLKNFDNKRLGAKYNFKLDVGLPIGTLTFAYNLHGINWDGEKHGGRYFLTHFNFYNLHALAGMKPFAVMYLPTGTYAKGNTKDMSYRELDFRAMMGIGFNETAYLFHDENDPYLTGYINNRRFSLIGIKGLIEAFADFDLWDLAYGQEPSGLNAMMEDTLGDYAKYLPVPYANIFWQSTKAEIRYYDIIQDSYYKKPTFGWNAGVMYTHSFYWDLGPGRLIVQPRVDLPLFDSSIHDPYNNNGYMAFRTGIHASVDVCYFF